jgi:hypothetical protein
MAPGRLADRTELVLCLMGSEIFVGAVNFLAAPHAHAPVVMHLLRRRIGTAVVKHQEPMRVGMFEHCLTRLLGNLLERQEIGHHHHRFLQIVAFHVRRGQSDGSYHGVPSEIQAFESYGKPLGARRNS